MGGRYYTSSYMYFIEILSILAACYKYATVTAGNHEIAHTNGRITTQSISIKPDDNSLRRNVPYMYFSTF